MHSNKFKILSVSLCVAVFYMGCVGFRGRTIPEAPRTERKLAHGPKKLRLTLEFQTNGNPNPRGLPVLNSTVVPAIQASGLFDVVSTSSDEETRAPYRLHITVNNIATGGAMALAILSGIWCGLTLTLLPGYARDWYEMTATLYRRGIRVATYRFKDYKSLWIQFFLLFAMPFKSMRKPLTETLTNLTWHVIAAVHKDLRRWDQPGADDPPPRPAGEGQGGEGGGESLAPTTPPGGEPPGGNPPQPRGSFPSPEDANPR